MIFSLSIIRKLSQLNKINFSSNGNKRCSSDLAKNRKNMNKGEIKKGKKIKRIPHRRTGHKNLLKSTKRQISVLLQIMYWMMHLNVTNNKYNCRTQRDLNREMIWKIILRSSNLKTMKNNLRARKRSNNLVKHLSLSWRVINNEMNFSKKIEKLT